MAGPKPGDKQYKGPVHEAVRSFLGGYGYEPPKNPTPAKSRSGEVSANRAAYNRDVTRSRSKLSMGAAIGATIGKYGKRPSSKPKAR